MTTGDPRHARGWKGHAKNGGPDVTTLPWPEPPRPTHLTELERKVELIRSGRVIVNDVDVALATAVLENSAALHRLERNAREALTESHRQIIAAVTAVSDVANRTHNLVAGNPRTDSKGIIEKVDEALFLNRWTASMATLCALSMLLMAALDLINRGP